MEGCHKISDFDEDLPTIRANLRFREINGVRRKMSSIHGDYVKQLSKNDKVFVEWISTRDNVADIFTKPLERDLHWRFTRKLFKLGENRNADEPKQLRGLHSGENL